MDLADLFIANRAAVASGRSRAGARRRKRNALRKRRPQMTLTELAPRSSILLLMHFHFSQVADLLLHSILLMTLCCG